MTTERQQSKINGCLGDGLSGRIHCVQYPLQVAVDSRINLLRIKIFFIYLFILLFIFMTVSAHPWYPLCPAQPRTKADHAY